MASIFTSCFHTHKEYITKTYEHEGSFYKVYKIPKVWSNPNYWDQRTSWLAWDSSKVTYWSVQVWIVFTFTFKRVLIWTTNYSIILSSAISWHSVFTYTQCRLLITSNRNSAQTSLGTKREFNGLCSQKYPKVTGFRNDIFKCCVCFSLSMNPLSGSKNNHGWTITCDSRLITPFQPHNPSEWHWYLESSGRKSPCHIGLNWDRWPFLNPLFCSGGWSVFIVQARPLRPPLCLG